MTKKLTDKLGAKRMLFVQRTALALCIDEIEAKNVLSLERQQGVRINTLKTSKQDSMPAMNNLGWKGSEYPWCAEGLSIDFGKHELRDSSLVDDGSIYIQNAASWLPVLVLDPQPNDDILDICAAPGGKTSHIAARSQNQAHITANDNSRPRLNKLRANMDRLGVQNIEYTLYDATYLARKLAGRQFSKILLDAPCSGEGMMNIRSDKDMSTWSVAHIKRLQQLQKRLISQAWHLLAPGGTLVYSTCTIAPEENESVVNYLLRNNEDAKLESINIQLPNRIAPVASWNGKAFSDDINQVLRLAPSSTVEAFFVAKICRQPVVTSDDM